MTAGQGVLNIACGKNLPYPESTGYTRIRASVNLACPVMLVLDGRTITAAKRILFQITARPEVERLSSHPETKSFLKPG